MKFLILAAVWLVILIAWGWVCWDAGRRTGIAEEHARVEAWGRTQHERGR